MFEEAFIVKAMAFAPPALPLKYNNQNCSLKEGKQPQVITMGRVFLWAQNSRLSAGKPFLSTQGIRLMLLFYEHEGKERHYSLIE